MTKIEMLEIFNSAGRILTPDRVAERVRDYRRRCSVYSYLLRLSRQGLLEQTRIGDRIAYRLTPRGVERLFYLKQREENQ